MNARETAVKNLRIAGVHEYDGMSFSDPDPKRGYGLILHALSVLAPSDRRTQIQVAKIIGRPVTESTTYRWNSNYQKEYLTKVRNFSTHGAWAALSHAKLIEKRDGAWTVTELGKRYMAEMQFA